MILNQPLVVANRVDQYDVMVNVAGGGLSGQAGAVRHGLAKALTYYEPELRAALKKEASSPATSRVVERKKYGHAKARRSFQFSQALSRAVITDSESAARRPFTGTGDRFAHSGSTQLRQVSSRLTAADDASATAR